MSDRKLTEYEIVQNLATSEHSYVHIDDLEKRGIDVYDREWAGSNFTTSHVVQCIYCNAPWSEKMLRLYEQSGYCETCWDSESVIYIFCSSCGKLVYRK